MEIKIDTKKDSPKEIQHMIDFLTRFISAQERTDSTFETPAQEGLFGLFDQSQEQGGVEQQGDEREVEKEEPFVIQPY